MDLLNTVIPKSDQLNFDDVQFKTITAKIKAVRAGDKEQPVFIDIEGYEGKPYKPSKSMRRVLIGGWGSDGHLWVGRSLTLMGDPSVRYGGVAVGGIKVSAMSDISSNMSFMITTSRGRRSEHRVSKLQDVVSNPQKNAKIDKEIDAHKILCDFTVYVGNKISVDELKGAFGKAWTALNGTNEQSKAKEVYELRKTEIEAESV